MFWELTAGERTLSATAPAILLSVLKPVTCDWLFCCDEARIFGLCLYKAGLGRSVFVGEKTHFMKAERGFGALTSGVNPCGRFIGQPPVIR